VNVRVARSRELVAEGHRPSVVARIAGVSRQALYRVPRPRRMPASPTAPPADEVEAAIVAEAESNPTDGYRMVCAWVRRRLARPVNRKRVLRVMRERGLIQRRRPLDRRRRPGFFRVERPDQLWHLDLTSVWVAEHGWVYLMAAIDCCSQIAAVSRGSGHRIASQCPIRRVEDWLRYCENEQERFREPQVAVQGQPGARRAWDAWTDGHLRSAPLRAAPIGADALSQWTTSRERVCKRAQLGLR
jgi:helix-turn-helix protein